MKRLAATTVAVLLFVVFTNGFGSYGSEASATVGTRRPRSCVKALKVADRSFGLLSDAVGDIIDGGDGSFYLDRSGAATSTRRNLMTQRLGDTIFASDTLVVTRCASCGVLFAIPEQMLSERRRTGASFWCPSGHSLSYHETDAARLTRQLANTDESLRIARADAEVQRNRTRSYKGHLTRLKNRIGSGRCPCCTRSFRDLAAHMREAHPGYDEP